MAMPELGLLSRQCLDRRIPEKPMLIEEVSAGGMLATRIMRRHAWHFTNSDAHQAGGSGVVLLPEP